MNRIFCQPPRERVVNKNMCVHLGRRTVQKLIPLLQ